MKLVSNLIGFFSLYLICNLGFVKAQTSQYAPKGEYIILSGGCANQSLEYWRAREDQHDKWWGNFIRTARMRMQELRTKFGDGLALTWLVYKPAYQLRAQQEGRPLISYIESVRDKYNCKLIWVFEKKSVIKYINRRGFFGKKIIGFEYFGHSNKYCIMLDYSTEVIGASKAWIHQDDVKKIKGRAFARNPFIKSWGCHSGESFSKLWHKYTNTSMWGAIGKTDYSHSYRTLPTLSSPNGKWVIF